MSNPKMIYKVYQDNKGRMWKVEKVKLPTYRGHISFWLCQCFDKPSSFRESKLSDVLNILKNQL